jgi:ceramide glucosyltransferase
MIKEGNQAMFASCHLGSCPNLIGGIMALRREALQEIGGLESIAHELMDDVALGKTLEKKGYRLLLTPTPCLVIADEENLSSWFRYNHRWFLGLRTKNPFSFALVLLNPYTLLLILAFLALVWGLPFWPYLALGGGFALFRTLWLWGEEGWTSRHLRQQHDPETLTRLYNLAPARVLLKPLADLSILFFLFSALFWPVVTWRGRRYRIFANGEVASQTT